MHYQTEILRFKEGARSRHPSPDATLAVAQPNVLVEADSQLAVLVDLTPPLPYRSREIRTLVVKTYWSSSGSVVARLRRALAAANRHLVNFNQKASVGSKCSGNITCVVFAGEELFLGQIGAGYAYVHHPSPADETDVGDPQFEIFPKRDRLLIPLGGTLPPVIHISYTLMKPGSVACLTTTQIAEAQAREVWQQAMALPKLNLIAGQLTRDLAPRRISGSVILAYAKPDPTPKPAPWLQSRAGRQRPPAGDVVAVKEARLSPKPASRAGARARVEAASHTHQQATPARDDRVAKTEQSTAGQPGAAAPSAASPADVAASDADSVPSARQEDPGAQSRWQLPQLHLAISPLRLWLTRAVWGWRERLALRAERRSDRTTTAERARLRQALRRLLPGKVDGSQKATPRTLPDERPAIVSGLVLGLLLVVALITLTTYMRLGGASRADELLEEVRILREEAYGTQDPAIWRQVLELATQVTYLNPESEEAAAIRQEARQAVEAQEMTSLLNAIPLLELGVAPTTRRVVAGGGWVYVLNTVTDSVIGLRLGEDGASHAGEDTMTILMRGQTYDGEPVNHLVDLAWIEPVGARQDGTLLIYSDGGKLFKHEPGRGPDSITAQQIQGDLEPGSVMLMETYGPRLYLVHRHRNQILTYEPVGGVYEAPRLYFADGAAPDLHQVQDLAIDGRLYVLMGNDTVRAYFTGTEDFSFQTRGLPEDGFAPLVMVAEPDPNSGRIYLADTQRDRIIALDKSGAFVHQYNLPSGQFRHIESLALGADPPVLYLVAENRLYAAPMPHRATR